MLQVGTLLDGKYKILNEIGHGGMSTVYLALNERANKTWAVKEVRKTSDTNYEVVRQGLIAETNILKRLNHPHLPNIVDIIDHDDAFIIVMDYIEGQDLQKRMQRAGTPLWEAVVDWGIQLCDVLEYLHSQTPPIIYRDMKPANVMLREMSDKEKYPWGMVMLLDFGTAREYKGKGALEDTTVLGTRGFAAPEQYGGHGETDARTDIYNLGATMYNLVTGHMPDEAPYYAMLPIREWDPSLPPGLEAIILKCTMTNKEERYQSAAELKYALQHVHEQSLEHITRQRRRWGTFLTTAGLCVLCALLSVGCRMGENYYSTEQYADLLAKGNNYASAKPSAGTPDYQDAEQAYKAAIELQPGNVEAYNDLLAFYRTTDSGISFAEYDTLDGLTPGLRNQGAAYERFCFDFGENVFYYLVGDNGTPLEDQGIRLPKNYLQTAANSDQLGDEGKDNGEAKRRLAQALYSISNSYDNLQNPLADYGYEEYWEDLTTMDSSTLIRDIDGVKDAQNLALRYYQMILSNIYRNYAEFSSAGISASTMENQIIEIESGLSLFDMMYPGLSEDSPAGQLRSQMDEYITLARRHIGTVN